MSTPKEAKELKLNSQLAKEGNDLLQLIMCLKIDQNILRDTSYIMSSRC